jgi:hypothetical protein
LGESDRFDSALSPKSDSITAGKLFFRQSSCLLWSLLICRWARKKWSLIIHPKVGRWLTFWSKSIPSDSEGTLGKSTTFLPKSRFELVRG